MSVGRACLVCFLLLHYEHHASLRQTVILRIIGPENWLKSLDRNTCHVVIKQKEESLGDEQV